MNPPKIETTPKNTNSTPAQPVQAPSPAPAPQPATGKMRPVTIQISDSLHRKLKMVAFSKGATTSGLCESYIEAAVKRDVVIVAARLNEE